MIDQALQTGLQSQFNFERFSAEVYEALAVALNTINLGGFAEYLHKRGCEERTHAKMFSDYLADRNILPALEALPKPAELGTADPMQAGLQAFSKALAHEHIVSDRLDTLYDLAEQGDDPATCVFMQWFVHEQVEEIKSLEEWVTLLTLAQNNGAAIIALNDKAKG